MLAQSPSSLFRVEAVGGLTLAQAGGGRLDGDCASIHSRLHAAWSTALKTDTRNDPLRPALAWLLGTSTSLRQILSPLG
jgi:hypothetical protein